ELFQFMSKFGCDRGRATSLAEERQKRVIIAVLNHLATERAQQAEVIERLGRAIDGIAGGSERDKRAEPRLRFPRHFRHLKPIILGIVGEHDTGAATDRQNAKLIVHWKDAATRRRY